MNEELINKLIKSIAVLQKQVSTINDKVKIFTNKEVAELLQVQVRLIKKYRDDGLLPYHQAGDKFWYTRQDIETFMQNTAVSYTM